ncbi:MAG: helix-turn-helix transcriptional regulator [Oscillospiraceae bacterium]|nr:helix-turn-helix transcriptional regulator [Oscillospiraceae bacterium]MBR4896287.1 helix-turn-helix transcriptional regulator [Clostridia bacterium]
MTEGPKFERPEERNWDGTLPITCYDLHTIALYELPISPNWHNEMEIVHTKAELALYINNTCHEAVPGDVFFINPRQIHSAVRKGPGEVYAVVFDLNILKMPDHNAPSNRLIDDILQQSKRFITKPERDSALYLKTLNLFENIEEFSRKPIRYGAESYSLLSCLYGIMAISIKTDSFAEFDDKSRGSMRYVMELIDYINGHYRESLTAEVLSKQLNLSPTYVYSLFRTYLGVTPLNYINSVRLREAYHLLEHGRSVTEAAYAVGIPNVSYFIKLFKNATGVTPLQWKSRKKQK